MTFELLALLTIFAHGLVIGYAIGAAHVNWPLVNWFRNYFNERAEERMRQHTRFLIAQINLFGAVASRRSAGTRADQGGRYGSRQSLLPNQLQLKGGDAEEQLTPTEQPPCFVSSKPSTGARLPIERP